MNKPTVAGDHRPLCESAPKNVQTAPVAPVSDAAKASSAPAFVCDAIDAWFVPVFYCVGYAYIALFYKEWSGARTALFSLFYLSCVLTYTHLRGRRSTRAGWFWSAATALCAISFFYDGVLWQSGGFITVKFLFLSGFAVYTTLVLSGALVDGQTGTAFLADLLRGFIIFPFGNFFTGCSCLYGAVRARKAKARKMPLLGVFLGILLSLPLLGMVLPLLSAADERFGALIVSYCDALFSFYAFPQLIPALLALPVAAYLFGLSYGCAHGRRAELLNRSHLDAFCSSAKVFSVSTVCTLLCIVCALYSLFIGLQASYLFSAFFGIRPDAVTYADYARQGFFELCRVAALNLCLLIGAELFCCRKAAQSRALRWCEALLCALTLGLILSAQSRMALYIHAYGLTILRVTTSLFLVFLAVVFLLVLLSLRRPIPVVRIAVGIFAVGFLLLSLSAPQRWIDHYNTSLGYVTTVVQPEYQAQTT